MTDIDTDSHLTQAVEMAWVVIANAYEGNWDEATDEWRAAAAAWRDKFLLIDVPKGEKEK